MALLVVFEHIHLDIGLRKSLFASSKWQTRPSSLTWTRVGAGRRGINNRGIRNPIHVAYDFGGVRPVEDTKNVKDKRKAKSNDDVRHPSHSSARTPSFNATHAMTFRLCSLSRPFYAFCMRFRGSILSVSTASHNDGPCHTLKSRNWILVMTWMTSVGFFRARSADKSRLSTRTTSGKCIKISDILRIGPPGWLSTLN